MSKESEDAARAEREADRQRVEAEQKAAAERAARERAKGDK